MSKPASGPIWEGSRRSSHSGLFPSCEGLGVGSRLQGARFIPTDLAWEIAMNSRSRELNASNELIDVMRFSFAALATQRLVFRHSRRQCRVAVPPCRVKRFQPNEGVFK